MPCRNNTFVGVEPRCEVDYFMEKKRLSAFIGLISFIVPALWLFVDFGNFMRLRRQRRWVSYKPDYDRGRVNLTGGDPDKLEIVRSVMTYISDSKLQSGSQSFNDFLESYGVNRALVEEAEDIFANKTVVRNRVELTISKSYRAHMPLASPVS
ncbi:hypothetical protein ElyMa_002571400 [Elysia marginata]|uniref:Uncharacterized protein n=1 Tax=Elysia marginata TaxID=1093978 RepID=A0AAV4GYU5_9GAST|nr:hypothetical protein ElyMa_002571400 [Elysia marginata]